MPTEDQILQKLNEILDQLARMEARQVTIKEDIKEQPVQGGFGTTEFTE